MNDDDEDDEATKVIPLRRTDVRDRNEREAQLDDYPVRRHRTARPCSHAMSQVDPVARTLTCRDCGAALDPIDVLDRIANQREHLVRSAHQWRRERDEMLARVEALKREETNAKSRIRTARRNRGDDEAIEAAAVALYSNRSYSPFESLPEQVRAERIRYVRAAVEAYLSHPSIADLEAAAR